MLLNVKSSYTFLKSTIKIEEYVQKAKEYGYQAVAISDEGVMHGVLEFYKAAQKAGLKALVGMEVELDGLVLSGKYNFLVYAIDTVGYCSLCQLSRALSDEKLTSKEVWQLISSYQGLIYISLGKTSEIESALIQYDYDHAYQVYQALEKVFSSGNIYLGQAVEPSNPLELKLVKDFSKKTQLPIVMTQLVRSLNPEDETVIPVLEAIKSNTTINHNDLIKKGVNYLYPKDELINKYFDLGLGEAVENTEQLIQRLNVEIKTGQNLLPKFNPPTGYTSKSYLEKLCRDRLMELNLHEKSNYVDRLDYELSVIDQMGFNDYFLIVWQIIAYCHESKIRIGPGRGSAAGSLVSYLLKITAVDPIEYNLLFERFLNPERKSMPDIDIDIPDNQRERVLKFVQRQYGHSQVAKIVTFSTFGAKQAVRDTLRVLGYDNNVLNLWSKAIPSDPNQPMTLNRAYRESESLRHLVNQSDKNQTIFQIAINIEGLPRQTSEHAAGVVINEFPLDQVLPVTERFDDLLITQYAMDDVEEIGLLKMDFLGLRNLTLLDDILKNIKHNQGIGLTIEEIPMDDPKTLKVFQDADTNGIFQFESDGIKAVLKRLKPESFEDIVAVNALYRPGPMSQIDSFIKRKHGQEKVTYLHPSLESILAPTYGIIVYQEQVMQIVQVMAGYSLAEADILRRAIGHKDSQVMEEERTHFVKGAINNGVDQKTAEEVYNYILRFSNYGFNRAHAVVYSTLAFQLAYLKAHYPLEFYQGVLNSGRSHRTTFLTYFYEAKRRLGKIKTVDINHSQAEFTIHQNRLMVGFNSVGELRRNFIQHILSDRSAHGPYGGLLNFLRRLPDNFLDEKQIQALIQVGAFDSFGYNRRTLSLSLDNLIGSVRFSGNNVSLFPEFEPKIEIVEEWPRDYLHERETEILGFSLAGHPLDKYDQLFETDPSLTPVDRLSELPVKRKARTIGIITKIREIRTKHNDLMAFVDLANQTGDISLVVFPGQYHQFLYLLKDKNIVMVAGSIDLDRRGQKQLIVEDVSIVSDDLLRRDVTDSKTFKSCWIRINDFENDGEKIEKLKNFTHYNPGSIELIIVDKLGQAVRLKHPYLIYYNQEVEDYLVNLFGEGNVVFQ